MPIKSEGVASKIRVSISEGGLILLTIDPITHEPIEVKTDGCPVFISTTINAEIEPQLQNRIFQAGLDESKTQSKKITKRQAKDAMFPQRVGKRHQLRGFCRFYSLTSRIMSDPSIPSIKDNLVPCFHTFCLYMSLGITINPTPSFFLI